MIADATFTVDKRTEAFSPQSIILNDTKQEADSASMPKSDDIPGLAPFLC